MPPALAISRPSITFHGHLATSSDNHIDDYPGPQNGSDRGDYPGSVPRRSQEGSLDKAIALPLVPMEDSVALC